MRKKEMIAMLLAAGSGSRLGVLAEDAAKPAVAFGGKYRIIDFPLSNCINSGIDTVGVLTRGQPPGLHAHIGIGIPWDLDCSDGGVTLLPLQEHGDGVETGTAGAVYRNLRYMESYNPEYVLILSGDHIYKMDYEVMLDFHRANGADVTLAAIPVSVDEAGFGIVVTDRNKRITGFKKPGEPGEGLASMGVSIFTWEVLRDVLAKMKDCRSCDFDRHIFPHCLKKGLRLYAYEFNGYWKDVATLESYWEANMELIDLIPEFNLYEEYWKIYTKSDSIEPLYISPEGHVEHSIVGEGCEISGEVTGSVIGSNVHIGKGARVRGSIIMKDTWIGGNAVIDKAIIAENCRIGSGAVLGEEEASDRTDGSACAIGLVTVGENSEVPEDVRIGKNTAISGVTVPADYPDAVLADGEVIIKAGDGV